MIVKIEPFSTSLEASTLEEALNLLRHLNTLVDQKGDRLSAKVTVDGFVPWWFSQEQVFWSILVPYTEHRKLFHQVLAGDIDIQTVPLGVANACHLLKDELDIPSLQLRTDQDQSSWRRCARSLFAWVSQVGLVLVSLISLLIFRLRDQDTLVYTIDKVSPGLDHDFRISNIYRELRQRGYCFAEYVHTNGGRPAWRNLWHRRRPVVFFEILTGIGTWLLRCRSNQAQPVIEINFNSSDLDEIFLAAMTRWILQRSVQSVYKVRILRWLLRFQGVNRAIILDDSRFANELVVASKSLDIPCLGYMHGLFNRYHPGLMAYGFDGARAHTFDLYGVWSEYFYQRLLVGDLYDKDHTFVCGLLRPPIEEELGTVLNAQRRATFPIRVLLISEPRARQQEVWYYIEELLDDHRFEVSLKTRPGEIQPHFKPKSDAARGTIRLIQGGTVYEAIAQADVVVGTYSTVLYEAILTLRPTVMLNTSFTYGHDLAHDGLTEFAESPKCVRDVVLQACALPNDELVRRRNAVWGDKIADGATTLFDAAERRLWDRSSE